MSPADVSAHAAKGLGRREFLTFAGGVAAAGLFAGGAIAARRPHDPEAWSSRLTARLPRRVRFVDSVQVRLGPERGFVFDQRTGGVYTLSASGAFVAVRIQERIPVRTIISTVVETFEVDVDTARRDFVRFAARLVEEGLAETDG